MPQRENEADLLAMARTGPASHLEKVVREYRKVGRAGIEQAQRQQEGRHLRAHYDERGMLVIEGRLPPEVGAVVLAALEGAEQVLRDSAESPGAPAGRPQPSQLRADALGLLAERALGALGTAERGEPYQVLVHIDAEVLSDPGAEGECCVEHGPGLSGATARRLSCDAPVVSLVEGQDGSVLSVGRKSRRVSKALWRALRARDRTCAWPGCTRRGHLAVHHVRHWADGGETALENLHLCCASHHLLLHEGGFTVEGRAPDGLVFRTPLGFEVRASYEAPDVPEDPVGALRERHAAEGLCIGPRTSQIDWWGQRLDVGLAVDALLREEERGQYEPALSWESGAEGDTGDECTLE